jgi:hypothetical protein
MGATTWLGTIGLAAMAVLAAPWGCDGDESGAPATSTAAAGGSTSSNGGGQSGGAGATGGAGGGTVSCADVDQDGHCPPADCDDENANLHPGQPESCGNAFDDDCNGEVDDGCLVGTTEYYVDTDSIGGTCSDSGPGTETQPWCTIAQANATLAAGELVFLRAGTYSGETIQPQNSGTSDAARIIYTAYPSEEVTLRDSVYCIRLQNRSYVSVVGLKFVDCGRNIYLEASDHNNVGYCEFDNPGGPDTWAGSRIYSGSQYNRIYHNVMSRYGAQSGSSGAWDDHGAILDIGNDNTEDTSDHNLVVGNTFSYGGHHILGVYANDNVVRGNTFHNEEWYSCHRTSLNSLCGNRNVVLNSSLPDRNVRNVIEDNIIAFSGVPPDQDTSAGLSVRTQWNIIRRNVVYENDAGGITLSADGGNHNDASNNRIYHNVLYRNGYPRVDDWDPNKSGMMLARWVDDAAHNSMTGVAIKNNIFFANQLHTIYFYYVDESDQQLAANWEQDTDPGFVDISGPPDPSDLARLDFHLQPVSPCVDGGAFLTETTGAGSGSTAIVVEDASYFMDGGGLVEPDMIQLEGHSQAVTITDIDYSTNTITVDTALDWDAGTGVSLPFFGAAPDQGAYELED